MENNLKFLLSRHLINWKGWKTNKKILVIESDDWGSVRMPSYQVYKQLVSKGYPIDNDPYERYDSLETNKDVESLFDLLTSFKDSNGKHPVLTANCVVANPNVEKIAGSRYEKYFFELCTDTFLKYPEHDKVWSYWRQGLEDGIFLPQFHAREHLNVPIIMEALNKPSKAFLYGFHLGYFGGLRKDGIQPHNLYVKASYYRNAKEKQQILEIFIDGLNIFRDLFGFASQSFVPTNYMWSPDFDETLKNLGVLYCQGRHFYSEPIAPGKKKFHNRKLGSQNEAGQFELVRNARFEPSLVANKERELQNCLKEIEIAFQWRRPAIISMHRINFCGNIYPNNRDENLGFMKKLLGQVLKKWPDVEFMDSVSLGKMIAAK